MKNLLKIVFVLIMIIGNTQACESVYEDSDNSCTVMEEPCAPIDLCTDACDPIAD